MLNVSLRVRVSHPQISESDDYKLPVMYLFDNLIRNKLAMDSKYNLVQVLNLKSKCSFDCFASLSNEDVYKVLTGLINNSCEACDQRKGYIRVRIEEKKLFIKILIIDSGTGVPHEILTRLNNKSFSYKKTTSTGFGLGYSQKILRSVGGDVILKSRAHRGTITEVTIPKGPAPSYLATSIDINVPNIVIIDEGLDTRNDWMSRLHNVPGSNALSFTYFESLNQLEPFLHHYAEQVDQCLFLIDFSHGDQNCLEFITKNKLKSGSLLVSRGYEHPECIRAVTELGLKILPKVLIPYIPIKYGSDVSVPTVAL